MWSPVVKKCLYLDNMKNFRNEVWFWMECFQKSFMHISDKQKMNYFYGGWTNALRKNDNDIKNTSDIMPSILAYAGDGAWV